VSLLRLLFDPLVRLLCARNLRSDRFGTWAAILGVALGTATVDVVVALDVNTVQGESGDWVTDPALAAPPDTIGLRGIRGSDGAPVAAQSAKEATHEDYEVMRSAIRLGSLAAFLVGALIVFFTFGVVVDRRRREVALLRSLGALPGQVAAIFVREAAIVGLAGAALGFAASVPMAYLAAAGGITTTGRAAIDPRHMYFPWGWMALFALVGAATALLGVLRPARDVLRLDVARALKPRFLEEDGARAAARRTRGITLIALPFAALVYALMRPFFRQALPSLTFFVLEAALVCASFLATLVLVPELVQRLGGVAVRLLPGGRGPERLLTQRRIERMGHELSWSVSGVMLVFSLLLALHIATLGLKREVVVWAADALHDELFLLSTGPRAHADALTARLPAGEVFARFTGRTPWPNSIHASPPAELAALAQANGRPDVAALARRLGPGKIVLSRMMARRFRVKEGDAMELSGRAGARRLDIVAVTDGIGFTPDSGPYRNTKTYGVIDPADADLIAPYAELLGAAAVVAHGDHPAVQRWWAGFRRGEAADLRIVEAGWYRWLRLRETDKDFVIFDLMLGLTSVLAAIGIANQLVLSVRARRRELALYRVLGMTTPQVQRLVLLEGGFIGLLGGALAALLGVPLGYAAVGALRTVSAFEVDFTLPPRYVLYTVVGSVLIAGAASLYPASQAARSDAAESVHYE
jgi:putative ABC transport system permease protein